MKFCHIAPTAYIEPLELQKSPAQLLLAHLVEGDEQYREIFSERKNQLTILDNSAYELYREGRPMFNPGKMVDLGKQVNADYLVLPDYPGEPGKKTIEAGLEYAEEFRSAGFGTFFVPQGSIGDLEDYLKTFAEAAINPMIDYIGVSILACPNAFGVDGNPHQQYLSRYCIFNILHNNGMLRLAKQHGKKIHFLGMTDGPNEICLHRSFISSGAIDTWDSSAAVWAGINDISFDNTPTGLRNGKVKSAVDFNHQFDESKMATIKSNIARIEASIP